MVCCGDPLRQWRLLHNGTSVWWQVQSRNKQSVTLNLKLPEGQEAFRRIALAHRYQYCEDFPPKTVLVGAIMAAEG